MSKRIVYKIVSVHKDTRKSAVIKNKFLCLNYEQDKTTYNTKGILTFKNLEDTICFIRKYSDSLASNIIEVWKCSGYIKKDQSITLMYCEDLLKLKFKTFEETIKFIENYGTDLNSYLNSSIVCSSLTLKEKIKTWNKRYQSFI
jgi:hypothetical protein